MRFEIISDMSDLLVLTKNNLVILITRDMQEITARLLKEDEDYRNRVESELKAADITTENLKIENKSLKERINRAKNKKEGNISSLTKLFEL